MQSLRKDRKKFLENIGYCPQFDAIIGVLTGREMLGLFADLRGIPHSKKNAEVNKWLKKLGLQKAGDVKCERYSGGMKRRLSVGMGMIGDPPIVLLDERKHLILCMLRKILCSFYVMISLQRRVVLTPLHVVNFGM